MSKLIHKVDQATGEITRCPADDFNPKPAALGGAALSAYGAGANGLAVAGDVQALVERVIAIDAALVACGILKRA